MKSKYNILLLGKTRSGKTCFKGQLFLRLETRESDALVLEARPEDLGSLYEAVKPLRDGNAPKRTAKSTNEQTILPLKLKTGESVEIPWHDYSGERIDEILENRIVSDEWKKRIENSDHWMLFIRPDQLKKIDNVFTRPREINGKNEEESEAVANELDDTSYYIELMQILAYCKGLGLRSQIKKPVLQVVLSCCDEIGLTEGGDPRKELRKRLPLFVNFLETNWESSSLAFYGLAALEKPLLENSNDVDYIDEEPESFGYIVYPCGKKDEDLALLITELLKLGE